MDTLELYFACLAVSGIANIILIIAFYILSKENEKLEKEVARQKNLYKQAEEELTNHKIKNFNNSLDSESLRHNMLDFIRNKYSYESSRKFTSFVNKYFGYDK